MNKHFRVPGRLALKLEELGVPVSAVLRRAGLPGDLFAQTRVLVTTPELFALWRAIGEVVKDPAIGLKLASETRTEHFHPSAIAALSTASFGAAVDHIARYKQLTCPEEILQDMSHGEWTIRFRWLLAVESEPHALVDCCFAWLQTIARHGSGTLIKPLRVHLVQPRAHARILERHFGCERSLNPSTVPPTSQQSKPSDTPTTFEVWTNDSNTLQGQHFCRLYHDL